MLPLEEYKEKLLEQYDSDWLVDLLRIEAQELLDRFEDKLEELREREERENEPDES